MPKRRLDKDQRTKTVTSSIVILPLATGADQITIPDRGALTMID